MKHVLKKPIIVLLPRPQVFVAACLAAFFSDLLTAVMRSQDWSPVWAYLIAALAGIWAAYFIWWLAKIFRRGKA